MNWVKTFIHPIQIARNQRNKITLVLAMIHFTQFDGKNFSKSIAFIRGFHLPCEKIFFFHGLGAFTRVHTGRTKIEITSSKGDETHLSIDPANIVISAESLTSSMRNSFKGRITAIIEENGKVRIEVDTGEKFHAYITKKSLTLLNLHIGDEAYISFKSTAVEVF